MFDLNNFRPHKITKEDFKSKRNVNNPSELDAYESLHIAIDNNLMNLEPVEIVSPLFNLVK